MSITIESRRPGDEAARQDLSRHAFAKASPFDPDVPRVDPDRDVCAYLGDRLVGAAATIEAEQVFGGRPVPMGAVGAVVVLPEVAGRGIASRLLDESFERMRARGEVISTQYPTLPELYRRLGYGTGGTLDEYELDLRDLPTVRSSQEVVELDGAGLSVLRQAYDSLAVDFPGWIRFGDQHWDRLAFTFEADTLSFAYEVRRSDGTTGGAVLYRLNLDRSDPRVIVDLMAASDRQSWAKLLTVLRWNSPAASRLVTTMPAELLFTLVPGQATLAHRSCRQWMTRIVDLPGAIEARGWAENRTAEIHLCLTDRGEPDRKEAGTVHVCRGRARFEPTAAADIETTRGDIEMERADFASLYTGWLTPVQARSLELLVEYRDGAAAELADLLTPGTPTSVHHF